MRKGNSSMAKKSYYAVARGKVTGIFNNWEGCKASVTGYSGALYKGFSEQDLILAEQFLVENGAEVTYNY